jgi:toxin ParE1/3/4
LASAALRYAELVVQALRGLEADPDRPAARTLPKLQPGLLLYQLASSRERVTGQRAKTPRHFILYRQRADAVLEVLRILHDSRDLARHLPQQ